MRALTKSVLLLLLVRMVSVSAGAQLNQETQHAPYRDSSLRQSARDLHPLTLDEGLAVLGAALDSRHSRGFTPDCSHFVHELYQRAGFPYTYASSTDLYSGVDPFERVNTPQAGDLIVWRGHVGIVINPSQHSFFSLLRSGSAVERYDSPYWRRRGHPRFLRYVKGNPGIKTGPSLRNAGLRPIDTDEDENDAGSREPGDDVPVLNRTKNFSSAGDRGSARVPVAQAASAAIPRVVVINSTRLTPEQVRAAFIQSRATLEESFGGRDIFHSAQPVVVFDHFVVRRLHISGTQGWAEVEINELVSLNFEKTTAAKTTAGKTIAGKVIAGKSEMRNIAERQRWPLIHRNNGLWELTPPQSTIYLPQDIATHLTAQRLAQLTSNGERSADRNQKTELAQLLNVLLQK